jgi:hypothetical protein
MNADCADTATLSRDPCVRPFGFSCPSSRDRQSCSCTCLLAQEGRCRDNYCATMNVCAINTGKPYRAVTSAESAGPLRSSGWPKTCISTNGQWVAHAHWTVREKSGSNDLESSVRLYIRPTDGTGAEELICKLPGPPCTEISLAWMTETHLLVVITGSVRTPIKVHRHPVVRTLLLARDE